MCVQQGDQGLENHWEMSHESLNPQAGPAGKCNAGGAVRGLQASAERWQRGARQHGHGSVLLLRETRAQK